MLSVGLVTPHTDGIVFGIPLGASTTTLTSPVLALEVKRARLALLGREPRLIPKLDGNREAGEHRSAVLDVLERIRMKSDPRCELHVYGTQLARLPKDDQHSAELVPEGKRQFRGYFVVVDILLLARAERLLNVARQAHERRLVSREQAVGLDVKDEAVWRPRGPPLGVLDAGNAVIAAVDLDDGELRSVVAKPLLRCLCGWRIEQAAVEEGPVRPGRGADEDRHVRRVANGVRQHGPRRS